MQTSHQSDLLDTNYYSRDVIRDSRHFRVDPLRALELSLSTGDRLEFLAPYGEFQFELVTLTYDGFAALEAISWDTSIHMDIDISTGKAAQTLSLLSTSSVSSHRLTESLGSFGMTQFDLSSAIQVSTTQATENRSTKNKSMIKAGISCRVTDSVRVIVIATGSDMKIDESTPPQSMDVLVKYGSSKDADILPRPLAPVKSEFRISRATAKSYRVEKGEWIQIIDVQGKQCSDFLAFDEEALKHGQEMCVDATATRTVLGVSNPEPGLYSRYLDAEMQSMFEVVQDTVGRHDSFMMACSPKYYEDGGYFGHESCSENFNKVLASKGVAPRRAWPAINFFFNTNVEPCGHINLDEPWSQAGDYVLLRASRDLVCASSACPDDVDPANGWVPTDIHVRIYRSAESFPQAKAYRNHPEEPPRMTKQSGFYRCVSKLTSKLSEYRGYWVADEFDNWGSIAEYYACREQVAMIDLSALRKFEIVGPDAEKFLQYVLTRNVRRLSVGEVVYSAICLETGGMIDDGTLFRMSDNAFRWICGDEYTGTWMFQIAKEHGYDVSIRHSSDQIHNVAIQGPNSRDLLASLVWTPDSQPSLESLNWFHFSIGRLNGPKGIPIMVSRTGYTGELGYEVWCHPDDAETLWNRLWHEGQKYGLAPLGFNALDMLRTEAGLIFADHEFSPDTNPFEAGIGFTVPLKSKQDDFIGRSAIVNQSLESRKKLMGLVIESNENAEHGDLVYSGRFPVGVITSAVRSPLLGKPISLCRLSPEFAEPGLKLEIGKLDGIRKRLKCEVSAIPFYDSERIRVRS